MKHLLLLFLLPMLLSGCFGGTGAEHTLPAETSTSAPLPSQTATVPTLPPTEPPEVFVKLLEQMSLEEKVGQLFIARFPDSSAKDDIAKYHLGGFVLFAQDFENETKDSISQKLSALQSASEIPLLFAVDEEGGQVNRISKYPAFRSQPFPSPRFLYKKGGLDAIRAIETEKAELLNLLGINVNLAPVCDITSNPAAFMYSRSLGQSPAVTAQYVQTVAEIMSQHNVGAVLKHFPGYGNNTDTHTAIAVDSRSLETLEKEDLVPFSAGISEGCDAIMISHVYINALDSKMPATLSPTVHEYLRNTMHFDGVIITDDLSMKAITDTYGADEAAVLAVLAGNDLLCSTEYQQQYEAILSAVQSGRIPETTLDNAVMHILKWKTDLKLLNEYT